MKELDLVINKRGFEYKQVLKNDIGYIYAQHFKNEIIAYEVFYRKENTQFNCISFPGDNSFGVWAWSCKSFDRALNYLK